MKETTGIESIIWNDYPNQSTGGYIIYYAVSHTVPLTLTAYINEFLDEIFQHTCIMFSNAEAQESLFLQHNLPYIKFHYSGSVDNFKCSSLRGHQTEGNQNIMLGPQCSDKVSVAQMIMRTLGAEYEHKRKLRNKYLSFRKWSQIIPLKRDFVIYYICVYV